MACRQQEVSVSVGYVVAEIQARLTFVSGAMVRMRGGGETRGWKEGESSSPPSFPPDYVSPSEATFFDLAFNNSNLESPIRLSLPLGTFSRQELINTLLSTSLLALLPSQLPHHESPRRSTHSHPGLDLCLLFPRNSLCCRRLSREKDPSSGRFHRSPLPRERVPEGPSKLPPDRRHNFKGGSSTIPTDSFSEGEEGMLDLERGEWSGSCLAALASPASRPQRQTRTLTQSNVISFTGCVYAISLEGRGERRRSIARDHLRSASRGSARDRLVPPALGEGKAPRTLVLGVRGLLEVRLCGGRLS